MPSPPALRAAKAIAASGKPKQGQTTEDHWARIIDRETGVADLVAACEAALEYMRFTGVSHGHKSPEGFWFDQDQNEWVLLIAGAARLQFEDETVEMKAGSFVNIPAHRRHRVDWTDPDQPTIWLAIHYQ